MIRRPAVSGHAVSLLFSREQNLALISSKGEKNFVRDLRLGNLGPIQNPRLLFACYKKKSEKC